MNMHKQAIDHAVLDAIRALQLPDNEDLVGQIVQTYINDSADLMLMLAEAVRKGESEGVRAAAHSLKSCSGNVGARQVVDIARRLEMAGRQDERNEFEAVLVELKIELARAVDELDEMIIAA